MKHALSLLVIGLLAAAPRAAGQSVFATGGFGVPVAPVDARAQALGGIGVGLLGLNASLVNPAEVAGYPFRGITGAVQSSSRSIDLDGQSDRTGSNRFPLLRIIYPVSSRLVASVGYGAFLDQSWSVASEGTEIIGTDTVAISDLVESDGGLAQLQVGLAYAATPTLALGLAGGLYTGSVDRRVTRTFSDSSMTGIGRFRQEVEWTERAPFISAGARWDPVPGLRFGASVTVPATLDVDADDDARDLELDLPLQVAFGASGLLAPRLTAALAARWAGWGSAADGFDPAAAPADTWEVGGGIEWQGATLGSREMPIRLGYRRSRFPFRAGAEAPTEWAASLGMGLALARTEFGPLASIDAALDRGSRSADGSGLAEDFWRFTVSLAVFGR